MTNTKKIKLGLALGSGGVKGLSHIGVIKVLEKNNIPIDFIAGSSIGALVGAHYAVYKDVEKLEKIALGNNYQVLLALIDPGITGGLIKGKKLKKIFKKWFGENDFNSLKIPLKLVATDLLTGEEVSISEGNFIEAVKASLSVPPIFKPVKYNSYLLSDGGLSNPLPDNVVREMGANIVVAVNLDNKNFDNTNIQKSMSLTRISKRALNIVRYYLAQNCLKTADIIIEPDVEETGLIGWNKFFNNKEAKKIIEKGEKAMENQLNQLKDLIKHKVEML